MSLSFSLPDTAPYIAYDPAGWTAAYAPLASGIGDGTYHEAVQDGALLAFKISASAFALQNSYPSGPTGADCGFSISINGSTPVSGCGKDGLQDGIHRVEVRAEKKGARVMGIEGKVSRRGTRYTSKIVDNASPEWQWEGPWTHWNKDQDEARARGDLARYFEGTASATNGTARATLQFEGEAIWLYGLSSPYGGPARIWIDGKEMANIDTTLPWTSYGSLMFFAGSLGGREGERHTLTFDALGRGEVVLDHVEIMVPVPRNWIQENLPLLIGCISGALILLLLFTLCTFVIKLNRDRRLREQLGWTRVPGTGFFGARYLPPGHAKTVEDWRAASRQGSAHTLGYEFAYGGGDKEVMSPGSGSGSGAGSGSASRDRLTGSSGSHGHGHGRGYGREYGDRDRLWRGPEQPYIQPLTAAALRATSTDDGSTSISRPPSSPGYIPYNGPISSPPVAYLGQGVENGKSNIPGVVGGNAAARAWLQRSTSRRSRGSTAISGHLSVPHTHRTYPRSGGAPSVAPSSSIAPSASAWSDASGVLPSADSRRYRGPVAHSAGLSPLPPSASSGFSSSMTGRNGKTPSTGASKRFPRSVVGDEDEDRETMVNSEAGSGFGGYGQPGRRMEMDKDEVDELPELPFYQDIMRSAGPVKGSVTSPQSHIQSPNSTTSSRHTPQSNRTEHFPVSTTASTAATTKGGRSGQKPAATNSAAYSAFSGHTTSDMGEPFTAVIATALRMPFGPDDRSSTTGAKTQERVKDIEMDRLQRPDLDPLQSKNHHPSSSGILSVPGATPSSHLLPSQSPLDLSSNPTLTSAEHMNTDLRRGLSIKSARTDYSFLNGPGESDSWTFQIGGVPGQDGMPALPQTAARYDSTVFPRLGNGAAEVKRDSTLASDHVRKADRQGDISGQRGHEAGGMGLPRPVSRMGTSLEGNGSESRLTVRRDRQCTPQAILAQIPVYNPPLIKVQAESGRRLRRPWA